MNAPLNLPQRGREIAQLAKAIREMVGDDDQAFVDTLEGETSALEAARYAVRWLAETQAQSVACASLAAIYTARRSVFDDRQSRTRAALALFMQEIGEKTLILPEATLSIRAGQPEVLGEPDVNTLPADLVISKRQPDRSAIRTALLNGREIEGLSLSNAMPSLQVRQK